MTTHLDLADADLATAVATLPTTVPASWSGSAATACQSSLDQLGPLMSGLSTLLANARSAVATVRAAS